MRNLNIFYGDVDFSKPAGYNTLIQGKGVWYTDKIESFAVRLKKAINLRGITQAELSKRTGISKSSISRYLKGDWEGKQDAVYALALALDVSEAWLMGFDAKIGRVNKTPAIETDDGLDSETNHLLSKLPPEKKQNVADYIRFLANSK